MAYGYGYYPRSGYDPIPRPDADLSAIADEIRTENRAVEIVRVRTDRNAGRYDPFAPYANGRRYAAYRTGR
jgi:hypothetical protein